MGAEFVHGSTTVLYSLISDNELETEEVFTCAQGDGGPDTEPTKAGLYGVYC